MNCQEVESKILEYCDAPASSELHNQVSLHLQRCEPCRNNYKLTRAESEILSESAEIPAISTEFTASVMNAIKKSQKLYPHSSIELIKEQPAPIKKGASLRIWGSIAAVAVLGLAIYSAGSYVPFKNVSMIDTPVANQEISQTTTSLPDTSGTKQPVETLAGQDPAEPAAKATSETKTNVVDSLATTPRMLPAPSGQEASRQILMSAPIAQDTKSTNYTLNDFFIANVPEQFQLTKINKLSENQAEYLYASSDNQQDLTISVYLVPNTDGSEALNAKINRVARIGTQEVMMGYSGNMPDQYLEKLADTIQLKTIKP